MADAAGLRMGLVALAALLHAPPGAQAGEPQPLKSGDRVRAWVQREAANSGRTTLDKVTGNLLSLDDSSLRIETSPDAAPVVVARKDVTRVEVSLRRSRRGMGALIGFGAGALAGIVMVATDKGSGPACVQTGLPQPGGDFCLDFKILEGPEYDAAGILLLGAIGAGLGALVSHGEKWERVEDNRLRLSVGPTRGRGVRIGLSLAF